MSEKTENQESNLVSFDKDIAKIDFTKILIGRTKTVDIGEEVALETMGEFKEDLEYLASIRDELKELCALEHNKENAKKTEKMRATLREWTKKFEDKYSEESDQKKGIAAFKKTLKELIVQGVKDVQETLWANDKSVKLLANQEKERQQQKEAEERKAITDERFAILDVEAGGLGKIAEVADMSAEQWEIHLFGATGMHEKKERDRIAEIKTNRIQVAEIQDIEESSLPVEFELLTDTEWLQWLKDEADNRQEIERIKKEETDKRIRNLQDLNYPIPENIGEMDLDEFSVILIEAEQLNDEAKEAEEKANNLAQVRTEELSVYDGKIDIEFLKTASEDDYQAFKETTISEFDAEQDRIEEENKKYDARLKRMAKFEISMSREAVLAQSDEEFNKSIALKEEGMLASERIIELKANGYTNVLPVNFGSMSESEYSTLLESTKKSRQDALDEVERQKELSKSEEQHMCDLSSALKELVSKYDELIKSTENKAVVSMLDGAIASLSLPGWEVK